MYFCQCTFPCCVFNSTTTTKNLNICKISIFVIFVIIILPTSYELTSLYISEFAEVMAADQLIRYENRSLYVYLYISLKSYKDPFSWRIWINKTQLNTITNAFYKQSMIVNELNGYLLQKKYTFSTLKISFLFCNKILMVRNILLQFVSGVFGL